MEIEAKIGSYKLNAASPGEAFTTAPEALILPSDKHVAEIVTNAANKNLFPIGYLDYATDKPVTRKELQELIACTIHSAAHGLTVHYTVSKEYTLSALLSADNAKILADIAGVRGDDRNYNILHSYNYKELAVYTNMALGFNPLIDGVLDADGTVTRYEAAQTLNAVLTLYTGEIESLADGWFEGALGEPVTRLEAVAAMLELYEFCIK